jgi:arginyl-tRNA synthetase
MIVETLSELVAVALRDAASDGLVEPVESPAVEFERPKRREHGDFATNIALVVARGARNPRDVAHALAERLPRSDLLESVEVAGPGFLNFRLSSSWLHEVVRRAADRSSGLGRHSVGAGATVNLEFVSANPTGPLNVVGGRHAAVGDAMARLLEAVGYGVTREFYMNDAGRQVGLFAESLEFHYLDHFGMAATFPEEGYKGDYVRALGIAIAEELGDRLLHVTRGERLDALRSLGLEREVSEIRATLERFGTTFDIWASEKALHDSGLIERAVAKLEQGGLIEERGGAKWFLSSRFGDDKDRVLVRSDGRPTYSASDVAYLLDKAQRGYDRLVYLWGADHHGTVPRLAAAAEALEIGRHRLQVLLVQIVSLSRGTETLKGSKRAGVFVKLDELIDEVGVDAARYTFLTRSIDAPLDFDIELAKEQAPENPVFYVQYAHARISSILRKAADQGLRADAASAPLELLVHASERELMRKLAAYEEVVLEAASTLAPQRITRFAEDLASTFSAFYRDCQVVSDDAALSQARLGLSVATKNVIADALALLGVGAPERM